MPSRSKTSPVGAGGGGGDEVPKPSKSSSEAAFSFFLLFLLFLDFFSFFFDGGGLAQSGSDRDAALAFIESGIVDNLL